MAHAGRAENDIVLPKGSAPEKAGAFLFHDGKTRLQLKDGVRALVNGDPLRTKAQGALAWLLAHPAEMPLNPDTTGKPDRITLGRLSMIVIQRGARFGIRLWDNDSAVRHDFPGSQWFPVQEAFRVTAQFTSYPQPKMIPILNVLGDTEQNPSPGYATFELGGKTCRRAISLHRHAEGRKTDPGFQQGGESALRVHGICHLPAAAQTKPSAGSGHGR